MRGTRGIGSQFHHRDTKAGLTDDGEGGHHAGFLSVSHSIDLVIPICCTVWLEIRWKPSNGPAVSNGEAFFQQFLDADTDSL